MEISGKNGKSPNLPEIAAILRVFRRDAEGGVLYKPITRPFSANRLFSQPILFHSPSLFEKPVD
ncbi:MAG: hypothetical protein IJJ88_07440 [Oscillospiraceae bacterium]|nr:hypothetical protein [Oscillospiraceae bacterium]